MSASESLGLRALLHNGGAYDEVFNRYAALVRTRDKASIQFFADEFSWRIPILLALQAPAHRRTELQTLLHEARARIESEPARGYMRMAIDWLNTPDTIALSPRAGSEAEDAPPRA